MKQSVGKCKQINFYNLCVYPKLYRVTDKPSGETAV